MGTRDKLPKVFEWIVEWATNIFCTVMIAAMVLLLLYWAFMMLGVIFGPIFYWIKGLFV